MQGRTGIARIADPRPSSPPVLSCRQSTVARFRQSPPAFAMLSLGLGMRPRNLVFITLLALCHTHIAGQTLTNALPPSTQAASDSQALPSDPGQEILPIAQIEPQPQTGVPVQLEARRQTRAGDLWTLSGEVVVHYRDYVLRADKVVYHQSTSELEAEGHLQLAGGPYDVVVDADSGQMRLSMHTARFYNVTGSIGVRRAGRAQVYSTPNPFLFSGRVLLQNGESNYRIVDGSMTNCRLPRPDWRVISRSISLDSGNASASNSFFQFLGVPIFYLPWLRHPVDEAGRESGFLIPNISNSTIKGLVAGEQVYWVINRSMDMVIGAEYFSKRGWAPNGDFRYRGAGDDHLIARWNALLDRGVEQQIPRTPAAPPSTQIVNQGGVDLVAYGRKDLTSQTRIAGNVEYLSSYVYRLVFNDSYSQAVNSEVASTLSVTHQHNGFIPSVSLDRFQNFASSAKGNEARILHLPTLRYDVLDRPLAASPLYWGLASSLSYLARSEPNFHARNVGRIDLYPHLSLPFSGGGWSVVPEVALRDTFYAISQVPDLTGLNGGTPTISHDSLNRGDFEASIQIRPPALERDFDLAPWHRTLRHVIEPELTYRYVGGIGAHARNVLLADTTDIATDTSELGFSFTQRFYLRPTAPQPCPSTPDSTAENCPPQTQREWASWQIAQKYFLNSDFGGALIPERRNVFSTTLDLTGVAFLTGPRNLAPITSRLRFEGVRDLRIQWDMDYDPKGGRLDASNIFAGFSKGSTTLGIGHALLNAVDESGASASSIQSQQLQPFFSFGKQNQSGFNIAVNAGYDFVQDSLQYGGIQAVYNWNCCGLTVGYRRFQFGSLRDETQYLYSFTLANFGSVGDIRRSNSVFRDPSLPPAY